jgi:chromosome segregation ATPase
MVTSTTAAVILHTSTASEPEPQMVALQQMFELLTSNEMVVAEREKTGAAEKENFAKLYQAFQRVSRENDALRAQAIQLKRQLSQLNRVQDTESNALNEQLRLAEQRIRTTQQEKDAALHQCNEDVAEATRRQLEAVQVTQDAARTQTETLESSHRAQRETLESSQRTQRDVLISAQQNEIATLNQSHRQAITDLQNQLTQKQSTTQAAVAKIPHIDQEMQRLKTKVQNLTSSLNQILSQKKNLTHEATVLETAYKCGF